jgi:hypothetical protein
MTKPEEPSTTLEMKELLNDLRQFDAVRDKQAGDGDDEVLLRSLESVPPVFDESSLLDDAPTFLREALRKIGITNL